MPEMTVKSAAKINLALDVTGKRPDGYHNIESVFQTVGLYDEITVKLTDSGINISCDIPEKFRLSDPIPCDERNIAHKIARKFIEENNLNIGCDIHIKKGIPSQAGMGGGSTDAAAVIYCLEKLTGGRFLYPERVGADIPFFLTGGTAYVEGIGEKIQKISDYSDRILVIAKSDENVSTATAYKLIDNLENPVHPDTKSLLNAMENAPETAYKYFGNLFEDAVKLPSVIVLKITMKQQGALNAIMTGSGSAVFGLFEDMEQAEKCAENLRDRGYFSAVCKTVKDSFIEL